MVADVQARSLRHHQPLHLLFHHPFLHLSLHRRHQSLHHELPILGRRCRRQNDSGSGIGNVGDSGKKQRGSMGNNLLLLVLLQQHPGGGVPLLRATYREVGVDLVVQSSVIQCILWFPILLFLLEFWRTTCSMSMSRDQQHCSIEITDAADDSNNRLPSSTLLSSNLGATMKKVGAKLSKNPNCYACALGFIWALLANRWHFKMPSIVEGSIQIMANAGGGASMFTLGLFMALQENLIACGMRLTIYGMFLRFVVGPITTAVGCLALGLRSHILGIAILQEIISPPHNTRATLSNVSQISSSINVLLVPPLVFPPLLFHSEK
ncbi:hypothetical protein ACS0TY_036551 [Phlomoides rotata]